MQALDASTVAKERIAKMVAGHPMSRGPAKPTQANAHVRKFITRAR